MPKRKAAAQPTKAPQPVKAPADAVDDGSAAEDDVHPVNGVGAGNSDAEEGSGGEECEGEGEDDKDDDDEEEERRDPRDFRKRLKEGTGAASSGRSASGEGEGDREDAAEGVPVSDGAYRNKQRVLVFSSRGITSRYRHLMEDLRRLLPHHKKDAKLDVGKNESLAAAVNAICEMKSCNGCVFLECRKKQDLFLWIGRTPHGPSAKFQVLNVHTMDELKLTGNCMLGSRPFLSFDAAFDAPNQPQWALLKQLLSDTFGTPRGHPKSKPFVDRVMSFFVADGKIWVRNYQVLEAAATTALERRNEKAVGDGGTSLVEIGPRFVLEPIRIFAGAFGGPTLFQSASYMSPNTARAAQKAAGGARFAARAEQREAGKRKREATVMPRDELADIFAA